MMKQNKTDRLIAQAVLAERFKNRAQLRSVNDALIQERFKWAHTDSSLTLLLSYIKSPNLTERCHAR